MSHPPDMGESSTHPFISQLIYFSGCQAPCQPQRLPGKSEGGDFGMSPFFLFPSMRLTADLMPTTQVEDYSVSTALRSSKSFTCSPTARAKLVTFSSSKKILRYALLKPLDTKTRRSTRYFIGLYPGRIAFIITIRRYSLIEIHGSCFIVSKDLY